MVLLQTYRFQHLHKFHEWKKQSGKTSETDIGGEDASSFISPHIHTETKSVVCINKSPSVYISKVKNEFRELNLTVFIRVPVKLGAENIWADKKLKVKVYAKYESRRNKQEPKTLL